jgi:integrase/recombinase XerD
MNLNVLTDYQVKSEFKLFQTDQNLTMRSTHTFAVNFIKRNCKDDKTQAFIYARITVDEEQREISLKERISAADWDTDKEVVKGKSEKAKSLNIYIEDVRVRIIEKYRVLCDKEALITAESVKQAYLGTHTTLKGILKSNERTFFFSIYSYNS